MQNENEKFVDEEWKKKAQQEKEEFAKKQNVDDMGQKATTAQQVYPEPSFLALLSGILAQALVHLGQVDNPITNKREVNNEEAKYLIDTLSILKEKTKGNLTKEEDDYLNESLYQLRLLYLKVTK